MDFEFGGMGGGSGFESIFEHFFGGRGGPASGTRIRFEDIDAAQPRDVERAIELSLEEIDAGATRTLTYQTMDAVKNRGTVSTVPTTRRIEVKIPAGIEDGKKVRVAGKGESGANGRTGDLFVTVRWAQHAKFKPVGDALEIEIDTPFTTAALGGEVRVPTLRSAGKITIPAGTQSGQTFRLAGQGIQRMNGGRGDLFAKIRVTVPKNLTPEERELVRKLADLEAKRS